MNKRGIVRIIESTISIIIVISVLFFIFTQHAKSPEKNNYDELARDTLDELAQNSTLRYAVLSPDESDDIKIENFLNKRIPLGTLDYDFSVCDVGGACGSNSYIQAQIYSQERVISSDVDQQTVFKPRKIRLFLWQKE